MHKFPRYHKFSETLQGCSRNFSAVSDQNFSTENYDTPFFHPKKTGWNKKFSQKSMNRSPKNSAQWEKNFSTEKCDTRCYAWNFSISQIFWNIEGMPTIFFRTVRQKTCETKTWHTLLCIKFFDTRTFLKHWRDAQEIFRHCETENFRRKSVITSITHKIFREPQSFWNIEGMPQVFRHCEREQFFSAEKCLGTPPLLSSVKTFRNQNFSQK